jgi:hypothetical protein
MRVRKDVRPGNAVDHALVHVHRAAGLGFHGLGHEGGKDAVAQCGLAHRALEQKHAVGQLQRIAVGEIDFHLAGAGFVDQGFDAQLVLLAKGAQLEEERIEIVDGIDRIRLPPLLGEAAAPGRRTQRFVRVGVARHQIKLHLGATTGVQPRWA